jgi:hypothetical protein
MGRLAIEMNGYSFELRTPSPSGDIAARLPAKERSKTEITAG